MREKAPLTWFLPLLAEVWSLCLGPKAEEKRVRLDGQVLCELASGWVLLEAPSGCVGRQQVILSGLWQFFWDAHQGSACDEVFLRWRRQKES